jgi:hypothetical protein
MLLQPQSTHGRVAESRSFHRSRILTRAQTPEDGAEFGSNLFNSQFMGVLQQSLARQGADALTKGVEVPDEARISAVEEVLSTALNQSKQSLRSLQQWRNQIDAQIAAQEKQVDRMEFALSKARSDGALLKTLKEMVYENNSD